MTLATHTGIVLLTLAPWLAGCSGSRQPAALAAPTPVPQPAPQPASVMLSGAVYDTAFRPLEGAKVEVLDGPQAGMSTTAGTRGGFSLLGAFDSSTTFRASFEGHLAEERSWTQCETCQHPYLGFRLAPTVPPVNLAGDYTLTLSATGDCVEFPDDLRTRAYTMTITATATPATDSATVTSFSGAVSGAPLFSEYRTIWMNVAGDYVTFWLGDLHGDPGIVEEVPAANPDGSPGYGYLGFAGAAAATVSDTSTIVASLDGSFDYCARNRPMDRYFNCQRAEIASARCLSPSHQLILSRR